VNLRRRWSALAGFGASVLVLATLGSVSPAAAAGSSAAAKQTHIRVRAPIVPIQVGSPTPFDLVFNNMDYNGGPVMPSNTDYAVYWSPSGASGYPDGYINGLATWFTDLAHDSGGNQNTDSVSAQYQDLTGAFAKYQTTFGGSLIDTQPYPTSQCPVNAPVTNCLTDAQAQTELERFVAEKGLPKDLSHEYFLLSPPHVEYCFSNNPNDPSGLPFGGCSAGAAGLPRVFCAYHENTTIEPFLIYANDPYVPGLPVCGSRSPRPNGFWDQELSGGLSHEQNESVTDPVPNDAWTNGAGALQGSEVGDQCARQNGTPLGTAPNGAAYNQVINGHFYFYQEEWSNEFHTCLQRLGPVGQMPTATFKVFKGHGLTLNFDATGSTAPGGVAQYVWQFNAVLNAPTIETTSPTISYTFPTAGSYSVGLTVFAANGLSTGTGGIVTTGQHGVSSGFTFSKAHNPGDRTITFSALANVSAQPVLVYFWDFGDGTVGSGQNPSHVYKAHGRYTVTLVMFSGVGSAFPGQGAGPISQDTIQIG
jgi:PKD repeat protein